MIQSEQRVTGKMKSSDFCCFSAMVTHNTPILNFLILFYFFLMQRLSVTLQRGNAACVLGTVASTIGLDDVFYLFIAVF